MEPALECSYSGSSRGVPVPSSRSAPIRDPVLALSKAEWLRRKWKLTSSRGLVFAYTSARCYNTNKVIYEKVIIWN